MQLPRLPLSRTVKKMVVDRQIEAQLKSISKGWIFSSYRQHMYSAELSDWLLHYLPISLQGKVVLDIGAGEGESAKFFLEHGARKVICIEPDGLSFHNLKANSKKFSGIVPLQECFDLKHLQIAHDFLKVDIEGYEEVLLETTMNTPAVIEIHGLQLRDRFRAKGYRIATDRENHQNDFACVNYAYWGC